MAAAAGCAALVLQVQAPRPQLDPMAIATSGAGVTLRQSAAPRSAQPAQAPRRIYPYSIVPGGLSSRAELARAVMADKVVAAHYVDFAVEKAQLRTVAGPRAVYVSYRKGDQVYWTARKVTLLEGETVLSDGVNDIRARCGNRISDTPRLPVEARAPTEQELDTPFEQFSEGEGGLLSTNFVLEDMDAGGSSGEQPAQPPSFPNGAGLLAAARPQASLAGIGAGGGWNRMSLATLPGAEARPAGFTRLANGAPSLDTDAGRSSKPGIEDPGPPPPATVRPDGLPDGTLPAKGQEVPEPGALWLAGATIAALLLQRRLRTRRPR